MADVDLSRYGATGEALEDALALLYEIYPIYFCLAVLAALKYGAR